jgi:hypothetical protein
VVVVDMLDLVLCLERAREARCVSPSSFNLSSSVLPSRPLVDVHTGSQYDTAPLPSIPALSPAFLSLSKAASP